MLSKSVACVASGRKYTTNTHNYCEKSPRIQYSVKKVTKNLPKTESRKSKEFMVQYVSDLHLEKRSELPKIQVVSDRIALCGDIGHPTSHMYEEFLADCSKKWKDIYLIAGNHEFHVLSLKCKTIQDFCAAHTNTLSIIRSIAEEHKNIHFIENETYEQNFDGGVVSIFGTTLWCTPTRNTARAQHMKIAHAEAKTHLKGLKEKPKYYRFTGDKKLILSHYPPSYTLLPEAYKTSSLEGNNGFNYDNFYNNDDDVIHNDVDAWIYGHTHALQSSTINGVKLVCNAVGASKYPKGTAIKF